MMPFIDDYENSLKQQSTYYYFDLNSKIKDMKTIKVRQACIDFVSYRPFN